MPTKTNDLAQSLRTNPVTKVHVQSSIAADWARRRAHHFWIVTHRGLGWIIYQQTLSQHLECTQELSAQTTNTLDYGITTAPHSYTRHATHLPYTLFIVEVDKQTPQYVYGGVHHLTTHPTSRILSIQWDTPLRLK
jgi:hypothetical protein